MVLAIATLSVATVATNQFAVAEQPETMDGETTVGEATVGAVLGQVGVANANEVTEFSGKLKGMNRGVLLITRDDGTEIMVQAPDSPAGLTFVATAKPPFLKPGMLVRFTGMFGPTGIAAAPIQKVELFQPVAAAALPHHIRESFTPGVHGDRNAKGKPQQQAIAKYTVVGALRGLTANGILGVQAGKVPLQVQLASDATFEIRFNNLALAQEGDPVSVAGFYQPPDDTKVKADRVTINPERVYGEPQEKPTKRVSRRRSRRDAKVDEDKVNADKAEAGQTDPAAAEEKMADDGEAGAAKEGKDEASDEKSGDTKETEQDAPKSLADDLTTEEAS